jgi:pimeloyl-ACP methyl ester carboxylesterase
VLEAAEHGAPVAGMLDQSVAVTLIDHVPAPGTSRVHADRFRHMADVTGGAAAARDTQGQARPAEDSKLVSSQGLTLAGEDRGSGPAVVLAHGLTATRRYVVHGSRMLERSGFRVVSYDARGHGESTPAPDPAAYGYGELVGDLENVLDEFGVERAVLVGASMGAATVMSWTLANPDRVSALVQITPAYVGGAETDPRRLSYYDALADGLERNGVEGFMSAYGDPPVEQRFKGIVLEAIRQRIARHHHPEAVAAALRVVPRSSPFDGLAELEWVSVPTLIVASHDQADPEHPYEVAEAYAERIPDAELVSEAPGESPLAWRGSRLSKAIIEFLERRGLGSG